jgi:hypothetical protein
MFRCHLSIQLIDFVLIVIDFVNFGICLEWHFDLVVGPSQDPLEAKAHFAEVTRCEPGSPAPNNQVLASCATDESASSRKPR